MAISKFVQQSSHLSIYFFNGIFSVLVNLWNLIMIQNFIFFTCNLMLEIWDIKIVGF